MKIQERLRSAANHLRTKPMPLADFIPLIQQAADALDAAELVMAELAKPEQAWRKPMTLDEIEELWEGLEHKAPVYLVRVVEAFHHIKEQP